MKEKILAMRTYSDVEMEKRGSDGVLRLKQGSFEQGSPDVILVEKIYIEELVEKILKLYGKTCTIRKKGRGA